MADLNARIKPKKSSTTGEVPQAADLEVAELAVNTADGKLFVKHTDNSIKEISGGTDITTESIDALSDVDTTTAVPTDGQVLTWVDANSQWEAVSASVDSVNGQVGAVQLDLEDIQNVAENLNATAPYSTGVTFASASSLDTPGEWGYWGTDCKFYKLDDNGVDRTAQLSALKTGHTFDFNFNNGALTGTATLTADASDELGDGSVWSFQTDTSVGTFGGPIVLTLSPQGPADGQVLAWVDANSQWEPKDYISKATLKAEVAAATDFADFQARIAAL